MAARRTQTPKTGHPKGPAAEERSPPRQTKFTGGAADGLYQEVMHASPAKLSKIKKILEREGLSYMKEIQLENIDSKTKIEVTKILNEPESAAELPCYCGRCTCGKHSCPHRSVKVKYPRPQSAYKNDFKPYPCGFPEEMMNSNKMPRFKNPGKIDDTSTYKKDYPPHVIEAAKPKGGVPDFTSVPFSGTSSYKMEYPNWGTVNPPQENQRKPPEKTMPFKGHSSYGDQFQPHGANMMSKPFRRPEIKKEDLPFDGKSSSMLDFKPFKIVPTETAKKPTETQPKFVFPGQFESASRRAQAAKPTKRICPCEYLDAPPNFLKTATYYNPVENRYYV